MPVLTGCAPVDGIWRNTFMFFQDFTVCEISVKLILRKWREDTLLDAGCITLFSLLCHAVD